MKNKKSPMIVAGLLAVAVGLWMLSGIGGGPEEPSTIQRQGEISRANSSAMRVRVQDLRSIEVTQEIVVSGKTEPNRRVAVRAETDGVVIELGVERGSSVNAGDIVAKLDMRDRQSRLSEAQALVEQRRVEHEAVTNLSGRQFSSGVEIAEANARLEGAIASRERVLLEISHTTLLAPFPSQVLERSVELGDFVRVGDTLANLVDMDPLIIAGDVNEQDISNLFVGGLGVASLVGGKKVSGVIRYISPVADDNTRTFRIELAVPNPDSSIRAGLTAEMKLSASRIKVHSLTPALLTLSDEGTVGVKTVDSNNLVRFYSIEIVGSSEEGISVIGLPDSVRLITVGQGFVTEGQKVEPVLKTEQLER